MSGNFMSEKVSCRLYPLTFGRGFTNPYRHGGTMSQIEKLKDCPAGHTTKCKYIQVLQQEHLGESGGCLEM